MGNKGSKRSREANGGVLNVPSVSPPAPVLTLTRVQVTQQSPLGGITVELG